MTAAAPGARARIGRAWRAGVAALLAGVLSQALAAGPTENADIWLAMDDGAAVLMRHAEAPGGGDPPGFRLDDCATQRNLDEVGRDQARRIGQAFRERGIRVGRVLSSRWCRARDTARLAFGEPVQEVEVFDSFFGTPQRREARTADARQLLRQWRGPGVLVVITHQVNITALTGVFPAPGEAVVLNVRDADLPLLGRIRPAP